MLIFDMPPFILTLLGLYYWWLFKGISVVILFIQEILAPDVADSVIKTPSHSEPGEGHDAGLVIHGNMPSIEEIPRRMVGIEAQGGCLSPHSEPDEGHDAGLFMNGNMPSIEEIPRILVGMETQGGCHTPHSEAGEGHDAGLFMNGNMPSTEEIQRAFHIASAERDERVSSTQPYSQGAKPEPRSKSPKLVLPASVPSSNTTTTAVCGNPPPVVRLISSSPLPARNNAKLQAIEAEFAKQVQKRKEAVSRATKAARFLRNIWTRDAKYRRGMKTKRRAEKQVRSSTYKLQAIRQEEMDILSNLEKRRRRKCERWAYATNPLHGTNW